MNLIPKVNLWVSKTVQVMKMSSTGSQYTGSSGPIQADGTTEVKNSCEDDLPTEVPKTFKAYINDPPNLEVPTDDPLHLMHEQKARNNPRSVVNRDIVEHLKSYFDDQIVYYKTMSNYNKSAMKRIKKIKKNWTKMLE